MRKEMDVETAAKWQAIGNEHSMKAHGDHRIHPECEECIALGKRIIKSIGMSIPEYIRLKKQFGTPSGELFAEVDAAMSASEPSKWTKKRGAE